MKKIHIVLLLLSVGAISGMTVFVQNLTTYETFDSATKKKDQFVVVKVKLDKDSPIEYDELKDPNRTVFYAIDHSGQRKKVIYKEAKPTDIERSEGIDLNGYMRGDHFECTKLQMKCPSKYQDGQEGVQKPSGTTEYKY
jgi:cytochrome c-type biogenesis protein CcmE